MTNVLQVQCVVADTINCENCRIYTNGLVANARLHVRVVLSYYELRVWHTSSGHAHDVHVHYASCQYIRYVVLIRSNRQIYFDYTVPKKKRERNNILIK